MGFHRRPPNSNVTLPTVGSLHLLKPGPPSGNWVQVVSVSRGRIVVRGVGNTHCEMRIPDWQFDDLIYPMPTPPVIQEPEPDLDGLMLEDGQVLLLENGEELRLDLDALLALMLETGEVFLTEDGHEITLEQVELVEALLSQIGEELHTEAGELLTT